ncbi:Transcription factor PERIANTHIA [Zea mays]|uniref:Transcription factor PERIANTHIA n=1 Tax=Zea mays TaxID=4577 RepID=A0A1D6LWH7_MAIZE|nr:Transcription factor PERIANTHIA [Zea mays]
MHRQPSPHAFSSSGSWAEQGAGGYRHGRDGATFLLPELLQRSPNPSSKSSSAATFVPPLAAAHGGGVAAPFGMAPLGVAAADEARFCMTPWSAAAHFENWGDSGIVVTSPLAETASTDVDMGGGGAMAQSVDGHDNSLPACKVEPRDHKAQRRLAQNREAARKSRMRKKAYIVELENSRSKLSHLEQELQRARQQGMFIASALAFDLEYARWLDEHQHHMNDLRVALSAQIGDDDLGVLVDGAMLHYDQMFRLKGVATRTDVFHVLSGMWMSPAERFFMWLGGFRSSELLKVLARHVEPLTEQQLVGICGLQQSLQQAEDALSQGMEALQQALGDTLAAAATPCAADSVTNYMGQMAVAMSKLATVENFLRQADLLRQQTLKQVRRILTTRQAARALLVISDYFSRLRALSSLWLTRPTD